MAPTIGDLLTTTLEHRAKKLADIVSDNTALLFRLKEKGNISPVPGGRSIWEELEYAENATFGYYSGYETIDITPQATFTAAEYQWKQAAVSVTMSGLEQLQNSGKDATINLMEARIKNAERTMTNQINAGCYSNGTGSGGKQIGGLQLLVPDAPSSGTVGGIDAATYTWWQSIKFGGVADGGAAVSAANIKKYLNKLYLQLVRSTDKPDLGIADNNYYELLLESLQAIQTIADPKLANAGFQTLKYLGMDVVCDGGQGGACPSNHFYVLNTNYIKYRPHSDRDMVVLGGKREPVNQDATVRILGWAGNMTSSNRSLNGVLIA